MGFALVLLPALDGGRGLEESEMGENINEETDPAGEHKFESEDPEDDSEDRGYVERGQMSVDSSV